MQTGKLFGLSVLSLFVLLGAKTASAGVCDKWLTRPQSSRYADKAAQLYTPAMANELIAWMRPFVRAESGEGTLTAEKVELIFQRYMRERLSHLHPYLREKVQKSIDGLVVDVFSPRIFKREISGGAREIFGLYQL